MIINSNNPKYGMKYLLAVVILLISIRVDAQRNDPSSGFLVKPYLQIGRSSTPRSLQLLWHSAGSNETWLAEYKTNDDSIWKRSENLTASKISVSGIEPFTIYNASFTSLEPGGSFSYRVSKNDNIIFSAEANAPKIPGQSFRVAISGDMGAGTRQAGKIAYAIFKSNPDLVAIAGDIVYSQGLISEYKTKFWPVYNRDNADTNGAPLMRSLPFVAAVGNHDADTRDLDRFPGALAYYLFWDQPLNGPVGTEGGAIVPVLKGSDANKKNFLEGAGDKYPRMTNFSFNYGNAHWTVLDSDAYVDWTDSTLRDWVIRDLENAKSSVWRFVLFHHPGFNSSRAHYEQQQMRLLAPIFEKGNVDIVFSGHVHNYQRTYPLKFTPDRSGTLLMTGNRVNGRVVNGRWELDKTFDGKQHRKPNGIIYIITGAGGAGLYNPEQSEDVDSWQKFTLKFLSTTNTFTVIDVNGKELTLRQVDMNGKDVDRIRIEK
jgi:acid phosphatase type 7